MKPTDTTDLPRACSTCSRRDALKLGACAAASLLAGATLTGCGGALTPLEEDVVIQLSTYPQLNTVGGIAEVPTNTSGFAHPIFVLREGEQDYRALSAECNHQSCDVEWSSDQFVCPCHDSTFARDGELQSGPASEDLLNFDTQLDGDTLTILANP